MIEIKGPIRYRWSGKFVAKNGSWKHMDRALVDYELIIMEKGTLYIEDEWRKYEVREGEYLLMAPTMRQRGYKTSKCRFYWMHFLPAETARITDGKLGKSDQGTGVLSFPRQGRLWNSDRLFVLLQQLQDADIRYMNSEYNGCLAMAVLYEVSLQMAGQENEAAENHILQTRTDEFLMAHLSENITVGQLARHFGYHEKYYSSIFKKATGYSVKQYVDKRKMERARYLLVNSNALVVEIAEHLGYENVQNFYHIFRKYSDCTPSEYREAYNQPVEVHI